MMVFQFTGLSFVLSLSTLVSVADMGPPTHSEWEPIPELTDEFDAAALDANKWHDIVRTKTIFARITP